MDKRDAADTQGAPKSRRKGGSEAAALDVVAAIRAIRRGASMQKLHQRIYGTSPDSLDLGQSDTLHFVVELGSARINELASVLRVDPSTVTRSIERLEKAGLVERIMDPADRRAILVIPTKHGRKRHDEFLNRTIAAWTKIVASFSDDDLKALTHQLQRLVDRLDQAAEDDSLIPHESKARRPRKRSDVVG